MTTQLPARHRWDEGRRPFFFHGLIVIMAAHLACIQEVGVRFSIGPPCFFGRLAQLVERLHGMQKVRSSTLLLSTISCAQSQPDYDDTLSRCKNGFNSHWARHLLLSPLHNGSALGLGPRSGSSILPGLTIFLSVSSSTWIEHLIRVQEAAGSNPVSPTMTAELKPSGARDWLQPSWHVVELHRLSPFFTRCKQLGIALGSYPRGQGSIP